MKKLITIATLFLAGCTNKYFPHYYRIAEAPPCAKVQAVGQNLDQLLETNADTWGLDGKVYFMGYGEMPIEQYRMIFPQDYCKAAMLNKNIARNLRKTATDWEIEFITDRPELYERIFKRNRNCDEGNITQVKGTK